MKKLTVFLGVLLALGIAAPALAEVVDFGDGIKWSYTPPTRPIPGPADKAYHETSEPAKHIPADQPPAAYPSGRAPASVPCELNAAHHVGE